jgi:MoaA/NifB/PqqE/SkfB family radical SAM enzyme
MTKTYCSKLWDHQYIHMSGNFRFCCATNDNILNTKDNLYNINNTSLETVWNSEHIRDTRLKMIAGKEIPECTKCVEQESRGYKSMRTLDNKEKNFSNTKTDGTYLGTPNKMELHYGNMCNLKCRMCSQNYSNQIGKELLAIGEQDKEFLDWVIKQSGNVNNWTNNLSVEYSWFQNTKNKNKLNQFISKNIDFLTVIGGEPTIITEFYELFDYCDKQGTLGKKNFTIVTNLTNTNPKMLERLPKLKGWTIWASMDGIGERTEYIRYPSNFNKIKENLNVYKSILKKNNNNGRIVFSPAVQLLNIDQLDEMIEWFIDFSEGGFGNNFDISWMAQVWYPRICNYDIAPREYRLKIANKLEQKLQRFEKYESIHTFYQNQIQNLRTDILDKKTEKYLQECFIRYNDKLDVFRGKTTWRQLLPDLEYHLLKNNN